MSTIKSKKTKTYIDAGVNIDIGDQFIDEIKPLAKKTNTFGAKASLGGFGSIFDLSKLSLKEPLLISKKFSESEIEKKILNIEHILYPKVIAKLLDNEININEHNIILCYD